MIKIGDALNALSVNEWTLTGEPSNETEFNSMFKKVIGVDVNDRAELSSNPSDFGITWSQVKAKYDELVAKEPLKADIEQAKKLLAESDWVVVKITELNLTGLDVSDQYLDILSHRKLMREVINAKETEIANV